jgi:hypothetical protein
MPWDSPFNETSLIEKKPQLNKMSENKEDKKTFLTPSRGNSCFDLLFPGPKRLIAPSRSVLLERLLALSWR